jgi:mono/diheme cytochrome c family protein
VKSAALISLAALALCQSWLAAAPTFREDVSPIFEGSCVSCHGPKKQMGRFRADLRGEYFKETGSGPWVLPGNSRGSRLVALLSGDIKTKKSPEKHVLSPEEIARIRAWIDSGAR